MLKAENISKLFPANGIQALDHFSLNVEPGEIVGLLGPNGAGKTTFIRIASGILDRDRGNLSVVGYDPLESRRKVAELTTWIPQEGASMMVLYTTGRDNIRYFSLIRGQSKKETDRKINDLLETFDIPKQVIDKPYRLMSGGQKQLTNIINGLVVDAELFFCDEISVSIDPIITKDIYDYLKEKVSEGKSVLLTSQNIGEVEYLSHRVAIIDNGKLIGLDKPRNLSRKMLKKEILDLIFDDEIESNKVIMKFIMELKKLPACDSTTIVSNRLRIRTEEANNFLENIFPLLEKHKLKPSIESGKANLREAIRTLKEEKAG